MATTDAVIERLEQYGFNPRKDSSGWRSTCPTHDDKSGRALSITDGKNQKGEPIAIMKCYSDKGCIWQEILERLDLTPKNTPTTKLSKQKSLAREPQRWEIRKLDGTLVAIHIRKDYSNGKKEYPWKQPNGESGLGGIKTADLPLYGTERLSALSDGDIVFITEGEKSADALMAQGYNAVSSCTGANNPIPSDESLKPLVPFHCTVWPDCDEIGIDHMDKISARLMQLGCKEISIVNWDDGDPKDDAYDAMQKGCTVRLVADAIPWEVMVSNLFDILGRVRAYIQRFVILNDDQLNILALYVAHTHSYRANIYTPYIHIYSPTAICGKSSLVRVLMQLVCEPAKTDSITKSALIRRVDRLGPTLMVDEFDALVKGNREVGEAMRGIFNSGFHVAGVYTMSDPSGNRWEDRDYSTFCPKVLSGISSIWETVASRSIPIQMIRATQNEVESLTKFDERDHVHDAESIKQNLADWGTFYTAVLKDSRPQLPKGLESRAQDICEPLIAIGDLAGGDWSIRARESAVALCNQASVDIQNRGVMLLIDCYTISQNYPEERIKTGDLIDKLVAIEESGWGQYNRGKNISSRQLSRLLKEFKIEPKQLRFTNGPNARGYDFYDFADAWERYCPSMFSNPVTNVTSEELTPNVDALDVAVVTAVTLNSEGEGEYLT